MDRTDTIAVIGTSPFAAFLSGLLAGDQSRAVVLVRDSAAVGHLAQGPDLAVAPLTRPETWMVLCQLLPEVLKTFSRFPQSVIERADVTMSAQTRAGLAGLGHIEHMARGHGYTTERKQTREGVTTLCFRDTYRLQHNPFWACVDEWLTAQGVRQVPPNALESVNADGSASIEGEHITSTVLADDTALAAHGVRADLDALGRFVHHASILTEPVPALSERLVLELDSGVALYQRATGALQMFGPWSGTGLPARLGATLGTLTPRLAGSTWFTRFETRDGAPVVGPLRRGGVIAIANLGYAGLIFAPAIARMIAGTASEAEQAWCRARTPGRASKSVAVSEFRATMEFA